MHRLFPRLLALAAAASMLAFPIFAITGESSPGVTSSNWAGYFLPQGPYHSLGGQWTMPRQASTAHRGALSIWLGLQASSDLIQGGTAQVSEVPPITYLFFENYPVGPPKDPLPGQDGQTRAKDRVAAYIRRTPGGSFEVWVEDLTRARSFHTILFTPHFPLSVEPEWLVEDSGNSTLPLAAFSPIQFSRLTVDGGLVHLKRDGAESESMVQGSSSYATPSSPGANGFAVAFANRTAHASSARTPSVAIDVVAPMRIHPHQPLVILGGGFGRRPGQVFLDHRRLKTLTWHPGIIRALSPATLPAPPFDSKMQLRVTTSRAVQAQFDGNLRADP